MEFFSELVTRSKSRPRRTATAIAVVAVRGRSTDRETQFIFYPQIIIVTTNYNFGKNDCSKQRKAQAPNHSVRKAETLKVKFVNAKHT